MIDNRHTLVKFLSVCCGEDDVEKEGNGESNHVSDYGFTSSSTVSLEKGVHVHR